MSLPCLLVALSSFFAPQKGVEAREPGPGAPAHKVYSAQSKDGLKYTWVVPKEYDGKSACDLTVILHGTGLDHRWGHLNNPAGVFRPDDVVVSVDGTSPGPNDTRLFLGDKKDARAFASFLTELRTKFVVRDVFLYGHSQGAFFVTYYAAQEPTSVKGVVAHAAGLWNWTSIGRPLDKVAISFMHGTADPVVPYRQSPAARDACVEAKLPLVRLRRLESYNHWPNAVRATEELDWCEGMTCAEPERALAAARRILTPKRSDEYQWVTTVGFSAARQILRRFEAKGVAAFESPPPEVQKQARALADDIDKHAAKHVAALEKQVKAKKDVKLAPNKWLGHLTALREDFRGVDVVEAYVKKIDYDALLAAHEKDARALFEAWYASGAQPKSTFATVVETLPKCFLVEGLPHDLVSQMKTWKGEAKSHGIDKKTLERWDDFEAWTNAREAGRREYEQLWNDWK